MLDAAPCPALRILSNHLAPRSAARFSELPSGQTPPEPRAVIAGDRGTTRNSMTLRGHSSGCLCRPCRLRDTNTQDHPPRLSRSALPSVDDPRQDVHPPAKGLEAFECALRREPGDVRSLQSSGATTSSPGHTQRNTFWQQTRSTELSFTIDTSSPTSPRLIPVRRSRIAEATPQSYAWVPNRAYDLSTSSWVDGDRMSDQGVIGVDTEHIGRCVDAKIDQLTESVAPRELVRELIRMRRKHRPWSAGALDTHQAEVINILALARRRDHEDWAVDYVTTLAEAQRHVARGSTATRSTLSGVSRAAGGNDTIDDCSYPDAVVELVARLRQHQVLTPSDVMDAVWNGWLDAKTRQRRQKIPWQARPPVAGAIEVAVAREQAMRRRARQPYARPMENDAKDVGKRARRTNPQKQPREFVTLRSTEQLTVEGYTPGDHFAQYHVEPDTTRISNETMLQVDDKLETVCEGGDELNDDGDGEIDSSDDAFNTAAVTSARLARPMSPCVALMIKMDEARAALKRAKA